MSENALPVSFYRSFMVLCVMFKSLSHFEFVRCEDVFKFHWFTCSCTSFPVSLPEETIISVVFSCLLCWKLIDHSMWVYLWAASSVPFIHMSVFVPISAALITVTLQYCLKSGRVMPLALFLSLRITLAILGLLWFHIDFRIICSSSVKNIIDNFRVQFSRSVVPNSLWHHGPQHARPPCLSPIPRVYPNPCPLSRWCH